MTNAEEPSVIIARFSENVAGFFQFQDEMILCAIVCAIHNSALYCSRCLEV